MSRDRGSQKERGSGEEVEAGEKGREREVAEVIRRIENERIEKVEIK